MEWEAMNKVTFNLTVSPYDYYSYYQGEISHIMVRSEEGFMIQFPAHHLRQFITHEGIHGKFEMIFNQNHECLGFNRLS